MRCLRSALVWSGLSGRRYRYRRGLNYPTEPGAESVPAWFEDDAVGAGSPGSAFRSHFRELVAAGSLGSQAGAGPASASADGRTRVARAVGICEPASAEASFGGGRRESLARRGENASPVVRVAAGADALAAASITRNSRMCPTAIIGNNPLATGEMVGYRCHAHLRATRKG